MLIEEAEQRRAVRALAHLAQHPAHGLVHQRLRIVEQAGRELKRRRRVTALDEGVGREDRDAALPQHRARGELAQQVTRAIDEVLADDPVGARVDEVLVVDPALAHRGEVPHEDLVALTRIPVHEDQQRCEPVLMLRVVEEKVDLVEREVTKTRDHGAGRRNPHPDELVALAVLAGPGLEEAAQEQGIRRIGGGGGGGGEGPAHVAGRSGMRRRMRRGGHDPILDRSMRLVP